MFKNRKNKSKKQSKLGTILINHIINNKRGYLIVGILFFIALIVGVFFVNGTDDLKLEEINSYFNNLIEKINTLENINFLELFKSSVISNIITISILWFGASTIVGILVVYGTILFKGFSIGYTISSIIACFGVGKGILIALSILLLHNIIYIPAMFGASVSGIKLYQSIMKNKQRDNIKIEVLRHTIFSSLMLVLMVISSLIEVYCSTNLFIILLKNT